MCSSGHSATLEELGICAAIEQFGCSIAVRSQLRAFDRQTKANQICRIAASPDYMTGSHAALAEGFKCIKDMRFPSRMRASTKPPVTILL